LKNSRTRIEYPIIRVRFLILIYSLLCILTVLFSRSFFIETLLDGSIPGKLNLLVFFTIPAVLMIFFGISIYRLVSDFIFKRPGSKFNARLLAYFAIVVIFSLTPITLMTSTALNQIVHFWQSVEAPAANRAANSFIAENYALHLERFENIIRQTDFSIYEHDGSRLPPHIASVQVFIFSVSSLTSSQNENNAQGPADNQSGFQLTLPLPWAEHSFTGDDKFSLQFPPSFENGFAARELPRDDGAIRYVQRMSQNMLRVISYNLGSDFDRGKAALDNQTQRFETINLLKENIRPLLIYYYIVFFLPPLLMTAIIVISFTRRITYPIVELTDSVQKVADGDFSIQILTRRDDELGTLIKSFNTMVHNMETSRASLVKSEKISIWQNMAQQLAHEIKNPLTPIKLSAERVLRRWKNDPQNIDSIIENSMMAIIQETEGLSILLNEFRTLSKPMEPSTSTSDLRESVEVLINSYSSSYPNVYFNIDYVENGINVKIEKNRLSQILTNLAVNAIDAMDGSGSIEIRSDLVKKREVCYCRISVRDSGNGISAEDSKFVFTPYFTTKESGTGLGLPIVERIVNDHGGAIWFDSAEGTGTTFYIDLPAEKIQ